VLPTGTPTEWFTSSENKSLWFHSETPSCKIPTNFTVDVLPRLKLLSAVNSHTPFVFPGYVIDRQKEFIWTKHIEGLNQNRQTISGLEPKRPIALYHFFTQHSGILGINQFHLLSVKLHTSFPNIQVMCISVTMVFISLRTGQLK